MIDQLRQQRSMMVGIVLRHWYNRRIMKLVDVSDGSPCCYNRLVSFRRQQSHLRRHHPWRQCR